MFARNKISVITASQLNSELSRFLKLEMRMKPNERLIVDSVELSKQIKTSFHFRSWKLPFNEVNYTSPQNSVW